MNSKSLFRLLHFTGTVKRELLAVGLTAIILIGLLLSAQPTSAVVTMISGPEEVPNSESFTYIATIDVRQDTLRQEEVLTVDHFILVIGTHDGDAVTSTFDQNGTLLTVDSTRDQLESDIIRILQFESTLSISPVKPTGNAIPDSAVRRTNRTDLQMDVGYGYGAEIPRYVFRIHLDAAAFSQSRYQIQVIVVSDRDRQFKSNVGEFEIVGTDTQASTNEINDTPEQLSIDQRVLGTGLRTERIEPYSTKDTILKTLGGVYL